MLACSQHQRGPAFSPARPCGVWSALGQCPQWSAPVSKRAPIAGKEVLTFSRKRSSCGAVACFPEAAAGAGPRGKSSSAVVRIVELFTAGSSVRRFFATGRAAGGAAGGARFLAAMMLRSKERMLVGRRRLAVRLCRGECSSTRRHGTVDGTTRRGRPFALIVSISAIYSPRVFLVTGVPP